MKHFLKFVNVDQKSKTNVYSVYNMMDEILGGIAWYSPWRQYVFAPLEIIISRECVRQLADFLDKKHLEQKQKLHGIDNE